MTKIQYFNTFSDIAFDRMERIFWSIVSAIALTIELIVHVGTLGFKRVYVMHHVGILGMRRQNKRLQRSIEKFAADRDDH